MHFDFNHELILENERVKLAPLTSSHFDDLLPFSLNEPTLWDFSITPASGKENLKTYLKSAKKMRENKSGYPFLVFDKKTQKVAGSTRFYSIDFTHRVLSIGYTWYGKEFHRSGLNRHCKFLMLSYAFETLKVERVEFRADERNKASVAAMEGIGCSQEGVLRNDCKGTTGRRNTVVLSMLKSEWVENKKEKLIEKTR